MNGCQESQMLDDAHIASHIISIGQKNIKQRKQRIPRECLICGKPAISPKRVGSPVKFCSEECRNKARLIVVEKYEAKKRKGKEERTCPICNKAFIAKAKGLGKIYCSKQCSRAEEHRRKKEKRKSNRKTIACIVCGKKFKQSRRMKFCSKECRLESYMAPWIKSECPICGAEFVQRGKKKRYCSGDCQRAAQYIVFRRNTLTRRAIKKNNGDVENINPRYIFDRDGWRCKICGKNTPEKYYRTTKSNRKLNAPTVDHIVPLTKGGRHIRTNVQCVCYSCNCKKGNRVVEGGEQLLMFG